MPDVTEQSGERHCVFRSGALWFALPAMRVREVSFRPRLVSLPGSPLLLAGICHFRNEFLAVLSLRPLVAGATAEAPADPQMLVLNGNEGPWALESDQVISLEPLETVVSRDASGQGDWRDVTMGWATFRDHSVRVLDAETLYETAWQALQDSWTCIGPRRGKTATDS